MNLNRWNTSRHCLLAVLCLLITACGGGASYDGADTSLGGTSGALTSSSASTGSLSAPRYNHTALMLKTGKVLVVGGGSWNAATNTSVTPTNMELYDPATGTWSSAGTPPYVISGSSATVLQSGKVLFSGRRDDGPNYGTFFSQAVLYDPANGLWTTTGSMLQPRAWHSTFLLSSGKVLVLGGNTTNGFYANTAELYDPATGTWSSAGTVPYTVEGPSMVQLPSGKVLVSGGYHPYYPMWGSTRVCQLYDPATNSWSTTGSMANVRSGHSAVLLPSGLVLAAGGSASDLYWSSPLTSAELYDPATGTWFATGSMPSSDAYAYTAMTLSSGKVAVVGELQVQVYEPSTGAWEATGTLSLARAGSTQTLLPSGRILVAGGQRYDASTSTTTYHASAELVNFPSWKPAASTTVARGSHSMTVLNNGRVLVAGGFDGTLTTFSAELYLPASGTWMATGRMLSPREGHTATLLASGRVLATGGGTVDGTVHDTVEQYDPVMGRWTQLAGRLLAPRQSHAAVRLGNGKVLVVGGYNGNGALATAEVFDPATGTWASAGSMSTARYHHTAVLLSSGKVLVSGGFNDVAPQASSDLYDPATNTWSAAAPMLQAREAHVAVTLTTGKVLVAGGVFNGFLATAELYDPATDTWTSTGSMATPRQGHSATVLTSGGVLVAGGFGPMNYLSSAELYSPSTGTWTPTLSMDSLRYAHQTVRLPSGEVLAMGGYGDLGPQATAELYVP